MIRYEDQCVGCPPEMGCLGASCPRRCVEIYVCDGCGEDIYGDVYEYDGEELCEGCLKGRCRMSV